TVNYANCRILIIILDYKAGKLISCFQVCLMSHVAGRSLPFDTHLQNDKGQGNGIARYRIACAQAYW
ncbi:MAG: hypothetical protein AAFW82_06620, partial [Pseudomonadota bacterium]